MSGRALSARAVALAVIAWGAALSGCDDDPTVANLEYMPDMVSSVAYDSFAPNPSRATAAR